MTVCGDFHFEELNCYNGFNRLKDIGSKRRTVLTPGFGSNFNLGKALMEEISKKGLYWQ